MPPSESTSTTTSFVRGAGSASATFAAALAEAGIERTTELAFRYLPFELNPDMPPEGTDRRAYRSQKFGSWARSQIRGAQVSAAGPAAGVRFDYDKVLRTSSTRLVQLSQQRNQPRATAALCEAIFAAYFSAGRDIGSPDDNALHAAAQRFPFAGLPA